MFKPKSCHFLAGALVVGVTLFQSFTRHKLRLTVLLLVLARRLGWLNYCSAYTFLPLGAPRADYLWWRVGFLLFRYLTPDNGYACGSFLRSAHCAVIKERARIGACQTILRLTALNRMSSHILMVLHFFSAVKTQTFFTRLFLWLLLWFGRLSLDGFPCRGWLHSGLQRPRLRRGLFLDLWRQKHLGVRTSELVMLLGEIGRSLGVLGRRSSRMGGRVFLEWLFIHFIIMK